MIKLERLNFDFSANIIAESSDKHEAHFYKNFQGENFFVAICALWISPNLLKENSVHFRSLITLGFHQDNPKKIRSRIFFFEKLANYQFYLHLLILKCRFLYFIIVFLKNLKVKCLFNKSAHHYVTHFQPPLFFCYY